MSLNWRQCHQFSSFFWAKGLEYLAYYNSGSQNDDWQQISKTDKQEFNTVFAWEN